MLSRLACQGMELRNCLGVGLLMAKGKESIPSEKPLSLPIVIDVFVVLVTVQIWCHDAVMKAVKRCSGVEGGVEW